MEEIYLVRCFLFLLQIKERKTLNIDRIFIREYNKIRKDWVKKTMTIKLEDTEWVLEEEYKDGFDLEALKSRYTDYFEPYDYILGDWSYGKLRLKGFCKKINKICNKGNDIKFKDDYLKDLCSYECKWFLISKVKKDKK